MDTEIALVWVLLVAVACGLCAFLLQVLSAVRELRADERDEIEYATARSLSAGRQSVPAEHVEELPEPMA